MTTPPPSDDVLVRYLLGRLPEAEVEPLDERSIADEALAQRMEAVENDLVDRYVRGELPPGERSSFEARYLSTARGRQKVAFAQALMAKDPGATAPQTGRTPASRGWLLAAAAVLIVLTGAALLVQQARQTPASAPPEVAAQKDPEPAAPLAESAVTPETSPAPAPVVVAFALPPARRGIAQPPTISLPAEAEVLLRLELEGDDFSEYAVVVKEAASGRLIHQASRLRSRAFAGRRIVSVTVPASSLPATHYIVELTGHASGEPAEPLSTYPFRVAAR